jgi:YesN/AraC family two-component response regulator
VRGGFAALIDAQDDMQVVGEAADGREALDLARRVFPHVVLMDIRMPRVDGLKATRVICSDPHLEATRVLVLTTSISTSTSTAPCGPAPAASC